MQRPSRPRLLDLWIGAALFVLPLVFFWQVTLGDKTLLPADNLYQFQPWAAYREQLGVPAVPHNILLSDLVLENLPWKQFIRDSLANREIPLWNPYLFAGVPFLAAGQHSAMYPFSVIYYVLPLDKAYGWFTVSQLWLAGLFMYGFMRGLGIGRLGSAIAAVAYQMSGFFIASVVFQMIIAAAAWFPFLLLMVEFTIRQRPLFGRPTVIPWIALGAVGLGMEILAGHVEFTYYALLVMGFWAACRLGVIAWQMKKPHPKSLSVNGEGRQTDSPSLQAERRRRLFPKRGGEVRSRLLKPAFSLVALVVLGMAVGAIQFIPTLELAGYNFREGSASFAEVRGYAYPARHALAFLMPNFYGSPAQHDYFDVFTGQQTAINWQRADKITVTDTYWEVNKNYVEAACYVGLLTLFLAAIALLNARFEKAPHARINTAGPYRAIFAALALISLTFVFGTITYAILYYGLPGINQLHSPFRWVFPLTLCLAALAGFGAEALQRARGELTAFFGAEYWRNGASASFTFRLARWLGWALIWIGTGTLVLLVLSRAFFERLHGPIESLFHKLAGADMAFPTVQAFYSYEFRQILFFGLFLLACGVVIRVSRCPIYLPRRLGPLGRRPVWEVLALVVLALDLVVASAGFNPAADPAWLKFEPPAITWLKQHDPQQWRFTAIEGPTHTMNANVGWLYGLQDIRGYDSMIPKQYVEYMNTIQPQNQLLYNRIAPIFPNHLEALDSPLLDLLSVKYVVSEIEIDTTAHPKYKQVYQDDAVSIYENTQVLPRVFVHAWLVNISDHGKPIDRPVPEDGATLIEASNNQIEVNVQAQGGRLTRLVVANSHFPGWRAYVRRQGYPDTDEKELSIESTYGNFMQVELPSGSWTVRFRYSPPSFQIGAFTTFIALAVIVFALLAWAWRRFYTEDIGESHGARRLAKNSIAPIALNFFNRAIDFAFAAIMMRVLGPADAGVYYYAIVIFGWFDTLTNFGLNLLLTREVARDRSSAGRYLLNSSVLRLVLAGIGVPLLILFFVVYGWLFKPVEPLATGAILLLYAGLIPNSISYGLTALFYAFEKAEVPAAVSTVSVILKAILGLAALLIGWGVLGLAGASIGINVVTLIILGTQARGLLSAANSPSLRRGEGESLALQAGGEVPPVRLDRALMREMIFVSWPLMLNNLLAGMFYKIDVTLLEPLAGNKVVGQYGSAYKWLDALGLIPSLFTMALLPIMSRQAHEDRVALQRNYHFAVKLLVMVALPTAVALTFLAHVLIGLLGGAQFLPEGAIALQLMVWFIPIGWINSLTNYVLVALDLQRPMRWVFLAGVGFNLIANLLFIPLFSYKAAAIITVLSEVVLQIGFYRLLRRALSPVPWISLLWKPVAAVLVMAAVLVVLAPPGTVGLLAGVAVGGALYVIVLLSLRPFTAWEISQVTALLPVRVRRLARLEANA